MQRDKYVDVVKGIGIISIVIGHSSWIINLKNMEIPIGPFVYLYHLAIFFFCSGYLYNAQENNIWNFIVKKIKGLYIPFVKYSFVYLLVRNLFVKLGILDAELYLPGDFIIAGTNILTFNSLGGFLSAFWFLPVMFIAMIMYASIFIFAKKLPIKIANTVEIVSYILIGVIGLLTTERQFGLLYNMQISYLMVPVIGMGYIFKEKKAVFDRAINVVGLIISGCILGYVLSLDIGIIELSKFMIINKWLFYPVTMIGIWFCLSLAKILCKSKTIEKVMAYVGENSYAIMAFHFLGFKILDLIVCTLIGDKSNLSAFPYTFSKLWFVYYIWGVVFSLGLSYGWKKVYIKLQKGVISFYEK